MVREQFINRRTNLYQGTAIMGWVLLGLGLITTLTDAFFNIPIWIGSLLLRTSQTPPPAVPPSSNVQSFVQSVSPSILGIGTENPLLVFLPALETILFYVILAVIQPRLFPY